MKIITVRNTLYLGLALFFSLFTQSSALAQWVKQNTPSVEGELIYYLFSIDKNTMWTYTRTPFADTTNSRKSEFLRTADGGKTYKKGTLANKDIGFYPHIQPFDNKTAHLISTDADGHFTFKRTIDTGATWQDMPYQPKTFPDLVYFWDKDNGIFISDPDSLDVMIMYTTNGGNTYTRLSQTNHPRMGQTEFPVLADFQVIGNTFFFWSNDYIADKWRVWRSLDRGRNWTAGAWFETGYVAGFTPHLAFTDNNNGLLLRGIGDNYLKPLYTEDGGATWKESGSLPSYTSWPLENIPNTQTMIAFFQDTVRKVLYSALTNDLGKTWNSRKDIQPYTLDSIFTPLGLPAYVFTFLEIVNNNVAWAILGRNQIYRYESSTPIVPLQPDLDLQLKADNDGLPLYGYVKYTLTLTNRGISPATGIKVNWLPPYKRTPNGAGSYAFVSSYSDKGRYDSWNGVWTLDKLDAGSTATATFHLFVLDNSKPITQTAQVTACNERDIDSSPNNMSGAAKEDDEIGFVAQSNMAAVAKSRIEADLPEVTVSPNPAKDKLGITVKPAKDFEWTVQILNGLGQAVFSQKGQSYQRLDIDVKSLENGLYFIEYLLNGERKIEKVLIQH